MAAEFFLKNKSITASGIITWLDTGHETSAPNENRGTLPWTIAHEKYLQSVNKPLPWLHWKQHCAAIQRTAACSAERALAIVCVRSPLNSSVRYSLEANACEQSRAFALLNRPQMVYSIRVSLPRRAK
jgi:hypothetical protein